MSASNAQTGIHLLVRIVLVFSTVLRAGSTTFPASTKDDVRLWVDASDTYDFLFFANSDKISEWRDQSAYENNLAQGLSGSVTVSSFSSDATTETATGLEPIMCVSFTDTFLERKGFLGLDASSDWTVLSILRFEGDDLLAPFVSSGFTFDGGMGTGWALAKISNELGWMAFGTNG
eukprot:1106475-Rhodomonas_salina.1